MEMAEEYGLNRMEENNNDDNQDDNDEGNAAAPPAPAPPTTTPQEIIKDEDPVEMIPEQEALVPHEVILAYAEPEMSQPHLYHTLMRDYEESSPRMMDDLDDDPNDPKMGVMIEIESLSLSL
jgi:hypothetical protein